MTIACVIVALLGAAAVVGHHLEQTPSRSSAQTSPGAFYGLPPSSWTVSLSKAQQAATFKVVVPNATVADTLNMTAVQMQPDGHSVFMLFPVPPGQAAGSTVRQPDIQVFETLWTGTTPSQQFSQSVQNDPAVGKSVCQIGSVAALCVEPNSSSDQAQSNPAYVEFDTSGTDVQISGGNNLSLLEQVAQSMLASS